jgi:cell division protein FtsI (penicillin-binding protein 3)
MMSGAARRLFIFAAVLCFWIVAIVSRLLYLQLFEYGDFVKQASRQQQRSIEVSPPRGAIYDRNGRELAMSVSADSVFAVPSEIPDQTTTASLLARILKTEPQDILARFKSSHAFCWIARKLDTDTAARIRDLNLKGIYFEKESKRFYPKRELAAQAIGFVGLDDEGLGGLERSLNSPMRGKPGQMLISLDARRHWFGRVEKQPDPGENVVLTIDEKIQYIAERELDAAMQRTHAAAGTVIVENPKTGEILALANRPTFDANAFHISDPQKMKNRAVSDIYEPGSTFKMVTIAAALEEKITNPEEVIDCQNGAIYIGNVRIRDHKPFGLLTVSQILANSSDVGAIKLGLRLGEERFDRYIRAFGFGSQTGIELPGETRGITKPVSRWSKVSIGAISMGQEIGISPVQLISMVSTIANDGMYTPPRIVAGTRDPSDPSAKVVFHPAPQRRVVSTVTAIEMKKMLEGVVLFGTGKKSILEGYTSAGKTGTAQKADPATGGYSKTKYVASFAGFAPAYDPTIAIAVILDSPVGPHEGGQVAAPVFKAIAQQTLAYLNVPQDVAPDNPKRQLLRAAAKASDADVAEGSTEPVPEDMQWAADVPTSAQSVAPVAKPSPLQPAAHLVEAKISHVEARHAASQDRDSAPTEPTGPPARTNGTAVVTLGGGVLVPSMIGKPVRAALEIAQESGIDIDVVGSGVAREQSPPAGTRIAAGARVAVRFSR